MDFLKVGYFFTSLRRLKFILWSRRVCIFFFFINVETQITKFENTTSHFKY